MARTHDDVLRLVRGLLDKADSTNYGPERDALISKADALMQTHAIESFMLEFAKPSMEREKPQMREFTYGTTGDSEIDSNLSNIFYEMTTHCRCKMGWYGWHKSKVVGYPADLEYLEMLFTSVRLNLAMNLEPKPDPKLTYEDNLALLKEAGMKWERVYQLLLPVFPDHFPRTHKKRGYRDDGSWGDMEVEGPPPVVTKGIGVRFTKEYTEYCKAHNRERIYSNPATYRHSFAEAYTLRIIRRLREMHNENLATGNGMELVLANMDQELLEALWEHFPELRPHPEGCDCNMCHRCSDPTCTRPRCEAARKPIKYRGGGSVRERAVDASAARRGRSAADTADLSGRGSRVGPGEKKGIGA